MLKGGEKHINVLLYLNDGKSFQKEGPVIYLPDGYTAHFRDPKYGRKITAGGWL